jgi:hypothetical protein
MYIEDIRGGSAHSVDPNVRKGITWVHVPYISLIESLRAWEDAAYDAVRCHGVREGFGKNQSALAVWGKVKQRLTAIKPGTSPGLGLSERGATLR